MYSCRVWAVGSLMSFLPLITFVTCANKTEFSTDGGQRGTNTYTMTYCAAVPAQATEQADDTLRRPATRHSLTSHALASGSHSLNFGQFITLKNTSEAPQSSSKTVTYHRCLLMGRHGDKGDPQAFIGLPFSTQVWVIDDFMTP